MTELNAADKIMLGGLQATAAYVGSTKVWPVFTPLKLSGCAVWMDASKLGLANGAAVTTWTNLGSGSQPTRTGTPTFRTNALNTNMPVVRIAQGTGKFRWYSGTGVDKDWTLIYVGRHWQLATSGRVIAAYGTSANILVGYHMTEMDQCYVEGWLTSGASPTHTAQWKLYSADSSSAGLARFFVNGVLRATGDIPPAKGWGGTLCISGYLDDANVATSQECDCEIAELVMYNRKLSDAERQQVENYLRTKWNPITPFKPTDLGSNLVGWFDAGDAASVLLAGTGVNQWVNKGAGNTTLTQSNDAWRPKYANQTVSFTTPQQFIPVNSPLTYDLVMVGRPNPLSNGEWRTLIRTSAHHPIIVEYNTTRLGIYNGGFFPAGALTWDNVWGLCYGRFTSGTPVTMSRDGGAMTSTGSTIAAAGEVPFTSFGAYQGPPNPTQGWGDIKEIIFLPYNFDSARQLLEGYLAHRWGLTGLLPAGHPYKTSPP